MMLRCTRHRRRDGKIDALRAVPGLSLLNEAELVRLASLAELVEVPAGTTLTREGTPAREAFLVVAGRLRVVRGGMAVGCLEPGDFAGEVALLDRQARATGLEAETGTTLAVFSRSAVQRLIHASPWFTHRLLSQLAARVRCGVPT